MEHDKAHKNKKEIRLFWLISIPSDRQCTSISKRSRQRCRNWSVKGRTTCRFHSGTGNGAKTAKGKAAIRKANTKHGKYSLERQKRKLLNRMIIHLEAEFKRPVNSDNAEKLYLYMKPMTGKGLNEYKKKCVKLMGKLKNIPI